MLYVVSVVGCSWVEGEGTGCSVWEGQGHWNVSPITPFGSSARTPFCLARMY